MLGALAVLLFVSLAFQTPGVLFVVCAALAVVCAVASVPVLVSGWSTRRLRFRLDDQSLEVQWPGGRARMPLGLVDGIYGGQRLEGELPTAVRWLPGWWCYGLPADKPHRLLACSAYTPEAMVLVTAGESSLVISPADPAAFRRALIDQAQSVEPVDAAEGEGVELVRGAPWSALADSWLLAAAAVGAGLWLLATLVLSITFGQLPAALPLRVDAGGAPVDVGSAMDLRRLVLGGLVVLLVDLAAGAWLHAHERSLARATWIVGAGLQVLVIVGLLHFLG